MQLDLTTPALLFPAIAILMLGYVNRYISAASVIRTFKKDYDSGYVHVDIVKQLKILKRRMDLFKYMLSIGALALLLACPSMLFIFKEAPDYGEVVFALSLLSMIASIVLSLYETSLSNKSLNIEVNDILKKEAK